MGISASIDPRGIATLTIENPAKLNVLDSRLLASLVAEADTLAQRLDLRAVVLRGTGERAFIGGADIAEMATLDQTAARAFITRVHQGCEALRHIPVPVLARIQGYALGAGLEIAASCDLRLAAADARFGMPEVRIGIPSVVEAALLPGLIGWGRTRRLLLTGETIDAPQALAWGLVEEVVSSDELDSAVERVVASILAAGPAAVRLQKQLLRDWEQCTLAEAIERGIDSFARAWDADEPTQRMAAFLQAARRRKRWSFEARPAPVWFNLSNRMGGHDLSADMVATSLHRSDRRTR
jgi:enoyl-CoA hydratase